MRTGAFLVCSLLLSLLFAPPAAADEPPAGREGVARRPNVVLIFADDQGYAEAGCQGLQDVPTPHIDSLAQGGVRFTAGYVTAPVCSPSRAGLLTGRYQQRFGHEFNPGTKMPEAKETGLPLGEKTIADHFNAAGYVTGLVGKWHLGMTKERHPQSRGFNEFFGFLHGAHPYLPSGRRRRVQDPIQRNGEPVEEAQYLTDAFGREAVGFIDRHHEKPFFLFLSFNAVHLPLQAKPKDVERFAGIEDEKRRTYAGMLSAMDENIGRVLQAIERHGLEKDTLIFFISDNGGPTPKTTSSNHPLSGFKGMLYEGGIRVPFLMRWDGKIPAGKVVAEPVSSLDVAPTMLAAAGIPLPKGNGLDGVDLLPWLRGESDEAPHDVLFWRSGPVSAVRWANYKFVVDGREGTAELFDLEKDISETRDIAADHPDVVKRIQALYAEWERGTIEPKWARGERRSRRGGR